MWHYTNPSKNDFLNNAMVDTFLYKLNGKNIITIRRFFYYQKEVWWSATISPKDSLKNSIALQSKDLDLLKIKSLLVAKDLGWSILSVI
tara:strand:+ start:89 stop:355 length:267 start_codon:yes stop_codon:yes gene_type:complete